MRVEAVVPAWMLADGEYVGLAPGDPVRTGFALAVTASAPEGGERFEQSGERPGLTTIAGRTGAVGATTVLSCPEWSVALLAAGRVPDDVGLQVEGWLTVEPYLWVPDGELARQRPEGRVGWTVARVRVVGADGEAAADLARLPGEADVDPDAAYVLDLTR